MLDKFRLSSALTPVVGLIALTFAVLAVADSAASPRCEFGWSLAGCLLNAHDGLAGALIASGVTLVAAWIAWTAVNAQINSERALALADREEAERLLNEFVADDAAGMEAAWRLIVDLPEQSSEERTERVRQATRYMKQHITQSERLESFREMARLLPWSKRLDFEALFNSLEEFAACPVEDLDDCLECIRQVSYNFDGCIPGDSGLFTGLWRRTPKAMDFAELVRWQGQE